MRLITIHVNDTNMNMACRQVGFARFLDFQFTRLSAPHLPPCVPNYRQSIPALAQVDLSISPRLLELLELMFYYWDGASCSCSAATYAVSLNRTPLPPDGRSRDGSGVLAICGRRVDARVRVV